MKKLFIAAVLIAALGGALYYFMEMRKPQQTSHSFQQQLIGTWKIDSVQLSTKDSGNVLGLVPLAIDSNYYNYTYLFAKDGALEKHLGDSLVEKFRYKLSDSTGLTFVATDSTKEEFANTIVSFEQQQFTLRAADSSLLYFKRQ